MTDAQVNELTAPFRATDAELLIGGVAAPKTIFVAMSDDDLDDDDDDMDDEDDDGFDEDFGIGEDDLNLEEMGEEGVEDWDDFEDDDDFDDDDDDIDDDDF